MISTLRTVNRLCPRTVVGYEVCCRGWENAKTEQHDKNKKKNAAASLLQDEKPQILDPGEMIFQHAPSLPTAGCPIPPFNLAATPFLRFISFSNFFLFLLYHFRGPFFPSIYNAIMPALLFFGGTFLLPPPFFVSHFFIPLLPSLFCIICSRSLFAFSLSFFRPRQLFNTVYLTLI